MKPTGDSSTASRRGARSRGQFPLGPEASPVSRAELLRRQRRRDLLRPRGRGPPGDRDADPAPSPGRAASPGGGRLFGQRQIVAGPRRSLPRLARIGRSWALLDPFRPGPTRSASWPDRCSRHFPRPGPTRLEGHPRSPPGRVRRDRRDPAAPATSALIEYADNLTMPLGRREASVLVVWIRPRNCSRGVAGDEARPSFDVLRRATERPGGRVFGLLTLRSDFLGSFQNHPALRASPSPTSPSACCRWRTFPR